MSLFTEEQIEQMRTELEMMKTPEGLAKLAKKYAQEEEVVKICRKMMEAEGRNFDAEFAEYLKKQKG